VKNSATAPEKTMNKLTIVATTILSLSLTGCSIFDDEMAQMPSPMMAPSQESRDYFQTPVTQKDQEQQVTVKNITHYVRGLMHDLVENLTEVTSQTPVGVTSFVYVDSDLQTTSLLGNQISESFMHEIHQFGIPVVDYKMMDNLQITDRGDFVYSRDFTKLSASVEIDYILTGTLAKHVGGYLLNARIIDIKSKSIVSSAQGFVPEHIARGVLAHGVKNGIKLTQG